MQYQGDPDYDAVFADRGDPLIAGYRADGSDPDLARWIAAATVRRELAGDLPDDVSLVGGSVSAEATLEVDLANGAPTALDPDDRADWLAQEVVLEAGYDRPAFPETVQVFRGPVRELAATEGERTGTVELIDGRDSLRAPTTIPPFGSVANDKLYPGRIDRFPTNLSAIIVAALHASGRRITPNPIPGATISVPLVGGALADIGWTRPYGNGVPAGDTWLQPGYFADAAGTAPAAPMPTGGGMGVACFSAEPLPDEVSWVRTEFWCQPPASGGVELVRVRVSPVNTVVIRYGSGAFRANLEVIGTTLTGPAQAWAAASGIARVTVDYRYSDGLTRLYVESNSGVSATTSGSDEWAGAHLQAVLTGYIQQLSARFYPSVTAPLAPTTPTTGPDVRPASVVVDRVDQAALDLLTVPAVDGRVAWDLIKEVASAELGMAGFDEIGAFYFRNRASVNGTTTPVAEWGVEDVDDIRGTSTVDSIRTRVTTTFTRRWYVTSGQGAETAASTAVPSYLVDDVLTLPTGTTEILLEGSQPFAPTTPQLSNIATAAGAYDVDNGWTLCGTAAGGSRYTGSAVTGVLVPVDSATWKLVAVNGSGSTKYVVWPTGSGWADAAPFGLQPGQGALWVLGRSIVDRTTKTSRKLEVADDTSLAEWQVRTLELPESPWRQERASLTALLTDLLADVRQPRLQLDDITVAADPRWQVGDVIKISDWRGDLPDMLARITRLQYAFTRDVENGMTATVSLRTLPTS